MLQSVIFGIDGTLVDSDDAHAQSWVDTFAEAGYEVPFDVVGPLTGMGADKLLPKTRRCADLPAHCDASPLGRKRR